MVWNDEVLTDEPFEKRLEYFEDAKKISDLIETKPFVKLTEDYKDEIKKFIKNSENNEFLKLDDQLINLFKNLVR